MTTTAQADVVDELYRATTTPRLVQVPTLRFLCLDGHGDPNTSPAYATAVQSLYAVSYAAELVARLAEAVAGATSLPEARELRLVTFEEGPAAQVLHFGPYAAEAPTIVRLHEFIRQQGLSFDAHPYKHHEIYLGDPRRAAPEELRTIIRQPYAGGPR